MDVSKLKPYDWVLVASGAVMLTLGMVLDWRTINIPGLGRQGGDGPFDFFFTGGIAWILVVALGVLAFLVAGGAMKVAVNWHLIFVGIAALATLLMLIRLIIGAGSELGVSLDRGPGMYVAFVAAAAALGGAIWKFIDSGGDLKSLTDPDTIKGAFKQEDR